MLFVNLYLWHCIEIYFVKKVDFISYDFDIIDGSIPCATKFYAGEILFYLSTRKRSWVGVFFSHGCLLLSKFFPKEKVDFVGDIKR